MAKKYWLFKSEPDTYAFERLRREGRTEWSGVRNYQARNCMQMMRVGVPGIVGTCKVVQTAYTDVTAQDPNSAYHDPRATREKPIWMMVDVAYARRRNCTICHC